MKKEGKRTIQKDEKSGVKEKIVSKKTSIILRLLNKVLFKVLLILILAGLLILGGRYGWRKLGEIKTEKSSAIVFRELVRCSELVTVKNSYSDIISIKKTRIAGFAKTFSIIKYTGSIRGGIADISKAKISVSERGKRVNVILPAVEVLSNDISNIEVFDESKSIFVSISLKDVMNEIRFNQESSSAEILETGFLEEAEKQAVKIVESVLSAAGFEEVNVKCEKSRL